MAHYCPVLKIDSLALLAQEKQAISNQIGTGLAFSGEMGW